MQVYEGTYRCAPCAVKRVPRLKISQEALDGMVTEIRMMSRLRHPNVVQLLACCFDPYVCLVLELAANGSLRDLLRSKALAFRWNEHASMPLGIARGLNYLHSFDPPIIHRDIKPANVSDVPRAAAPPIFDTRHADPRRRGARVQAGRLWGVEGPARGDDDRGTCAVLLRRSVLPSDAQPPCHVLA